MATAEEGLSAFRGQRPDLVILDEVEAVRAPIGLASAIKAETAGAFLPVILLVGREGPDARIAALQHGDDATSRPYHIGEVAARVEAFLRTRRTFDELRAQRAQSDARSFTDEPTGLRNRLFLNERLDEEWKRAVRYAEPLSLLVISLEAGGAKVEAKGAAWKDKALYALAQAMKRALRQIDLVTRYGSWELGALLVNTHLAGSLTCADRLRREIEKSKVDDGALEMVMGISFYPGKDITGPEDLVRLCSQALDRARAEGPGSICLIQHQGYLFGK
jgi:diguanylate cyclase (GGDEF)-like protein